MTTMTSDPQALTEKRGKIHGDWLKQSQTANELKQVMRNSHNWNGELTTYQIEALDMIVTKISRILTGDATEPDHWDDIAGYAFLGKGGHNA